MDFRDTKNSDNEHDAGNGSVAVHTDEPDSFDNKWDLMRFAMRLAGNDPEKSADWAMRWLEDHPNDDLTRHILLYGMTRLVHALQHSSNQEIKGVRRVWQTPTTDAKYAKSLHADSLAMPHAVRCKLSLTIEFELESKIVGDCTGILLERIAVDQKNKANGSYKNAEFCRRLAARAGDKVCRDVVSPREAERIWNEVELLIKGNSEPMTPAQRGRANAQKFAASIK